VTLTHQDNLPGGNPVPGPERTEVDPRRKIIPAGVPTVPGDSVWALALHGIEEGSHPLTEDIVHGYCDPGTFTQVIPDEGFIRERIRFAAREHQRRPAGKFLCDAGQNRFGLSDIDVVDTRAK